MDSLSYILFIVSALEIVFGLPFAFKLVPQNKYLGLRSSKILADSDSWYFVNFRMGLGLVISGLVTIMLSLLLVTFPDFNFRELFFIFALLFPICVSLKSSQDFLRKIKA
jgi:uncharacterized membrane protein